MQTSVVGYPRIGARRELKFAVQRYWRHEMDAAELEGLAASLRLTHWNTQQTAGIDLIPSGDFSFYDTMLDTSLMLDAVPRCYRELGLAPLDTMFAMARGYQAEAGDVHARPMKKWFTTNYHYIVPRLDADTSLHLASTKPLDEYLEAAAAGIRTKPVLVGPYTFLTLARYEDGRTAADFADQAAAAYADLLGRLAAAGAEWVQFDEPSLVGDLTGEDVTLVSSLYRQVLSAKGDAKVLLQTYFGDTRDCFQDICSLGFDGIGIDLVEGEQACELVRQHPLPEGTTLFAGVVSGRNIWRNHLRTTLATIDGLAAATNAPIVLSTACSLLHVPYSVDAEKGLPAHVTEHLAFADEKLDELALLGRLADLTQQGRDADAALAANDRLFSEARPGADEAVRSRVATLVDADFTRTPTRPERADIQRDELGLPLLPTTTIGSFPQTAEVKSARARHNKGELDDAGYEAFLKGQIASCIRLQEEVGLDVLVHGEYERNDMVEYFGDNLNGFVFTDAAWVQSYGTRCVKPPIIWGDVSRARPITVGWSAYAQSLTDKPVKGMLTGPVTILNWSFPREDVSRREQALQIGLAIRDEALDLEAHGIRVIQVDEAALREKLPLRKADWHKGYLDWPLPAFRLVGSGLAAGTQLHTHMCYSEFGDIIGDIDAMDADVISFEASRSNLEILDDLAREHFQTQVGPGVYDIHSPRVPSTDEIVAALEAMLKRIDPAKLWVNPDCGLKTRGAAETEPSLRNLVAAAHEVRQGLGA
ncbi:MAG: 5-methyltetrahydropteroyltriglutamate--homocysteine S-methyltransferase [Atopobiaceae bacterium]|nr:5-methyltetrahydropteroyltriglutamate--homocysteine S-methyltransferase [Atopobiaceae bacterium]MDD4380111.1 5-methyltetrahydropteroyltriglutamate--homocysteine S-methyltransferase [Atopobiaceae bacterium]